MHIVNEQGLIGVIEDGAALPKGARKATEAEIAYFEKTDDPIAANVPVLPAEAVGPVTVETVEIIDGDEDGDEDGEKAVDE